MKYTEMSLCDYLEVC